MNDDDSFERSSRGVIRWAAQVHAPAETLPERLDDGDLLDVVEQYQVQQGRLHAMRADAIAALWSRTRLNSVDVDQVVREVATIHDISLPAAARLLTASARLHIGLAAVRGRLEAGRLPWTRVELVLTAASDLDASRHAEYEHKVLLLIEGCTFGQARNRVRQLIDTMHPEGMVARHRAAIEKRHTSVEPGADGMGWLHLYLDAVDVAAIEDRLQKYSVTAHGDRNETRTLTQLRADTARDLLLDITADATAEELASGERVTARGCTVVPEVHVTVPVMTLLGKSEEPGQLRGHGPIDPETARWLTADAPSLYRLLTQPETQAVLSLGAEHYEVHAALRRYLQVRDEHCRYPGCNRPAHRCDIDHVRPWARGGPTDHDNLMCLCRRDHIDKDRGWAVRMEQDGTVTWTSPYGRVRVTRPATTIGWATAA